MVRCKITVLRRTINEDFAMKYTKGKGELCLEILRVKNTYLLMVKSLKISANLLGLISINTFLPSYSRAILIYG